MNLHKNSVLCFVISIALMLSAVLVAPAVSAKTTYCPTLSSKGVPSLKLKPTTNWSRCTLGNLRAPKQNLASSKFISADLRMSNFSKANLRSANFSASALDAANLAAANMRSANLTEASLFGVNLKGTNLASATLTGVKSAGIIGTPSALPTGWILKGGILLGPSADLQGANLNKRSIAGADLSFANLDGADLRRARVSGVKLRGAVLSGIRSGGIVGSPSSLPDNWVFKDGFLIGPGADLFGADISGVDWATVSLTGVSSGEITSTPASLPSGWVLRKGYLLGPGARLTNVDLSYTDLSGLDLTGADLSEATLVGVNLEGTDLTGAALTGVRSAAITGTPSHLPAGWILVDGFLVGPRASFDSVPEEPNFASADFSQANLAGISWKSTYGEPAQLPSGVKIIDDDVLGPGAVLFGTDLSGLDLSNVNLTGAALYEVNFSGTDLSQAILDGVSSDTIIGSPVALPTGWKVIKGYLVGPKADLGGAYLRKANLDGVDLSGATFNNAHLEGIVGEPSNLPTGWNLIKGYLVGPGVDLSGANLSNVDMSGINLTGARLDGANLSGARLDGANLSEAYGVDIVGSPKSLPRGLSVFNGMLYGPGVVLPPPARSGCYRHNVSPFRRHLISAISGSGGPRYGCFAAAND